MKVPAEITIIVLTLNEEANIAACLRSVCGWAKQVFVVDSFSTDNTLRLAGNFACEVIQRAYINEYLQRSWALDNLLITTEWIFFLDADERMPTELKEEIEAVIRANPPENGFVLRWRLIWMANSRRQGRGHFLQSAPRTP